MLFHYGSVCLLNYAQNILLLLDILLLQAQIPIPLTMVVSPAGSGSTSPTVGAHPNYTTGAVENITATPNSGYHFNHWSSNVADLNSASTTVTMDGDKTVTAYFALIPPELLCLFVEVKENRPGLGGVQYYVIVDATYPNINDEYI